jgi:hypothetical protein
MALHVEHHAPVAGELVPFVIGAECAYVQGPTPVVVVPTLVERPVSPEHRFAWWCRARGCGYFRPVDDCDHCRACVPPWSEVLAAIVDDHLTAVEARGLAHVLDPEGLYHLEAATAAVVAMERLLPPPPPPEELAS